MIVIWYLFPFDFFSIYYNYMSACPQLVSFLSLPQIQDCPLYVGDVFHGPRVPETMDSTQYYVYVYYVFLHTYMYNKD